jgi:hypothetical protein
VDKYASQSGRVSHQRLSLEFLSHSDVSVGVSFRTILAFMVLCLAPVWWIFKGVLRLKA